MASRAVRDLLLRLTGDPSDAEQALHTVAREVAAFDRLEAEATVDVDTTPAQRALTHAVEEVKKFGRLSEAAKVDLQTAGAEAQLQRLQKRLENLSKQDASPKVDLQVAKVIGQIDRVEAKLAALGRRKVNVDVDVGKGAVESTTRGLSSLVGLATDAGKGIGVLMTAFSGALPVVGGLGRAFTGAAASGARLGPIFLALIPIVLALAAALAVTLGGAIVALGASLAAAAAGVAALATAFAVALGPIVLVAIAAMARLAAILKAVKESEEQAATQARRTRDAREAERAATERLRDANANLKTTTVDGYRAMRDAAEEASDAVRGITDAELSRERAQLSLRQAKKDLADYRKESGLAGDSLDKLFKKFTDVSFQPKDLVGAIRKSGVADAGSGVDPLELADKLLRVREATQGVKNASDGVSDAVTRSNDAREKEQEFLDHGLLAYPPYAAAVKEAATAQDALAKTTQKLADAREDQGKALQKLSPLERRFARTFTDLKATLQRAFGPATEALFRGVLDFFDDLEQFAGRPSIRRALQRVGEALGDMFRGFGRLLRRKEVRDAFLDIADGAVRLIRALGGRGARDFFLIILRIARTALPLLIEKVESVVDWLDKIADKSGDKRRLERIIGDIVKHFDTWWGLAKNVARVLGAFFKDGKEDGRKLAKHISDIVGDFADWLDKNPEGLKKFFHDAAENTKKLADACASIAKSLATIVGMKEDIIEVFGAVVTGAGTEPRGPRGPIGGGGLTIFGHHFAAGGSVPGVGSGDIVPARLEPGEFVLRRSVAQAIGLPKLSAINAGQYPAGTSRGVAGMTINEQTIVLPPAPGHDQLGDPRHQAAMLARELRRRGHANIGGGGFGP